jgi:hypothetical protein
VNSQSFSNRINGNDIPRPNETAETNKSNGLNRAILASFIFLPPR